MDPAGGYNDHSRVRERESRAEREARERAQERGREVGRGDSCVERAEASDVDATTGGSSAIGASHWRTRRGRASAARCAARRNARRCACGAYGAQWTRSIDAQCRERGECAEFGEGVRVRVSGNAGWAPQRGPVGGAPWYAPRRDGSAWCAATAAAAGSSAPAPGASRRRPVSLGP